MSATGHSHVPSTQRQTSQWPCDNCPRVNPGDRKRCTDCGTSRH
jgi:RNA polymerase subunit RPABC4/transcription elongation factor Spt4